MGAEWSRRAAWVFAVVPVASGFVAASQPLAMRLTSDSPASVETIFLAVKLFSFVWRCAGENRAGGRMWSNGPKGGANS